MYLFSTIKLLLLFTVVSCEDEHAFSGLYPVVFTPFDHEGQINVTIIPAYAAYLQKCGLQGVIVGDIFGEGPSLGIHEKIKLYSAWVEAGKNCGLKVIGTLGGQPYPDTVKIAIHAQKINMDALFVYNQPYIEYNTPRLITDGFKALSAVVPDMPLFYAHCPEITGVHIHVPTLFQLASAEVPQFKGIALEVKLAVTIIAVHEVRKDQNLFISNSIAPGGATLMGFDAFGLVALNLFPHIIQDVIKYTALGDIQQARREQRKLNTLLATITEQGDFISSQKAALEILTGLHLGRPRAPLRPISAEGLKKIQEVLEYWGYETHI